MLDVAQRYVIRGYLTAGMSPAAIADTIGRINDFGTDGVLALRAAVEELVDETPIAAAQPLRPAIPTRRALTDGPSASALR